MSRDRCCVPGCHESGRSHQVLHGFPNPEKDPNRFREWVMAVGGDILGLNNHYIYKQRRVCHEHFDIKYCCRYNRISNIAVPTMNMPSPIDIPKFTIVEGRPFRTITNLTLDCPSTSKDPVVDAESSFNLNENVMSGGYEHEKENIYRTAGSPVMAKPSLKPVDTITVDNLLKEDVHQGAPVMAKPTLKPVDTITVDNLLKEDVHQGAPVMAKPSLKPVDTITVDNLHKEDLHQEKRGRKRLKHSVDDGHDNPAPCKKLTRRIAMTATEKNLHKHLVSVKVKLSKCRNKLNKQKVKLKAARDIFSNQKFVTAMENFTTSAKLITLMQFRETKKKDKGRRFSMNEKIVALTILKHSPKAYRFLRKIFILPSSQTLVKLIHKCSLKAGMNENIFSQLKLKAGKMKEEHKLCALLFDEMQLKANISYNERKDIVSGFVSNGKKTEKILADHAQVFMIRGLIKNYKQPIAYTFSAGATKGAELAHQIKDIIEEVQKAGFKIIATVCDQGTNNRQAIKILKEETRREYLRKGENDRMNENIFKISGEEIVPLYDPPHLLKGIRNNLLTKDLQYKIGESSGVAKWSHLQLLYQENPGYKNMRLIPTLTDNHVVPSKIGKMKVKYASQVFSRTVSSNMGYLAGKGIIPTECTETADFFHFMDNIFDSVNGSGANKKKHSKPLLGAVTPKSGHKKMWEEGIQIFQSLKFIKNGKYESVPTIQGWIHTLKGDLELIKKIEKDYNITSFWMRHLNQDSLENFFGAIRSHGCRNINPTVEQFEAAFATLLINNLVSVHAPGSNCEEDKSQSLHRFIIREDCEVKATCEVDFNDIVDFEITPLVNKNDPKIIAPLQYVSGYFIKESKKKVWKGCENCKKNLISDQQLEYIRKREYAGRNWLHNPKDDFINLLSEIQDVTDFCLKKYIVKPNLKELIKTILSSIVNMNFVNCQNHSEKLRRFLLEKTCRFFIYTYCKNINKIIVGRRDVDSDNDELQQLSKIYFNKHFKKK